jgi:hypothetical protein
VSARPKISGEGPRLLFKPKLDKIVELLVYLAHTRPHADQYQAVKFFYLADREHFNRYGRPVTFETYYALDYGPVASNALDLIKGNSATLGAAGLDSLPIHLEKRANIIILTRPLRPVNYDVFSRSDLAVFDEIIEQHGSKTFEELFRLTHSHHAYDFAWRNRRRGNRALMYYEDMLEDSARKAAIVSSLEPVAENMK